MKLTYIFAFIAALLWLPFAALADTITLESRGTTNGWAPVLVVSTDAGSEVFGLPGVAYTVALDGTLPKNTIMYSRNAQTWAAGYTGRNVSVDCSDRVGGNDGGGVAGAGPQGGCTW